MRRGYDPRQKRDGRGRWTSGGGRVRSALRTPEGRKRARRIGLEVASAAAGPAAFYAGFRRQDPRLAQAGVYKTFTSYQRGVLALAGRNAHRLSPKDRVALRRAQSRARIADGIALAGVVGAAGLSSKRGQRLVSNARARGSAALRERARTARVRRGDRTAGVHNIRVRAGQSSVKIPTNARRPRMVRGARQFRARRAAGATPRRAPGRELTVTNRRSTRSRSSWASQYGARARDAADTMRATPRRSSRRSVMAGAQSYFRDALGRFATQGNTALANYAGQVGRGVGQKFVAGVFDAGIKEARSGVYRSFVGPTSGIGRARARGVNRYNSLRYSRGGIRAASAARRVSGPTRRFAGRASARYGAARSRRLDAAIRRTNARAYVRHRPPGAFRSTRTYGTPVSTRVLRALRR